MCDEPKASARKLFIFYKPTTQAPGKKNSTIHQRWYLSWQGQPRSRRQANTPHQARLEDHIVGLVKMAFKGHYVVLGKNF